MCVSHLNACRSIRPGAAAALERPKDPWHKQWCLGGSSTPPTKGAWLVSWKCAAREGDAWWAIQPPCSAPASQTTTTSSRSTPPAPSTDAPGAPAAAAAVPWSPGPCFAVCDGLWCAWRWTSARPNEREERGTARSRSEQHASPACSVIHRLNASSRRPFACWMAGQQRPPTLRSKGHHSRGSIDWHRHGGGSGKEHARSQQGMMEGIGEMRGLHGWLLSELQEEPSARNEGDRSSKWAETPTRS